MTIFFTADAHFGHERIIPLCSRPFVDVDEMNHAMVSNFNSQLTDDDFTWFLGDAVMGKFDENIELISQIKGRKGIVAGNHDKFSRAYQRKGDIDVKITAAAEKYKPYFDEIVGDPTKSSTMATPIVFDADTDPKRRVFWMSHYPVSGDHGDTDRFPELRPKLWGRYFLLHGHVHELWRMKDRMFNVGVDVNDFRLVSEHEVVAWADTFEKDGLS